MPETVLQAAFPSVPRGGLAAQRVRRAWWMAAPMLLVLAAVGGWPLLRTIWFSLTDSELSRLDDYTFIGLENYVGEYGLLASTDWWHAVGNTLLFTGLSVSLETLLGLGVALLLNQPSRLRTLLRAALLVPWAIPTVVSAKMWSWMLHDQFGIVNQQLLALGLIATPLAWTADPQLALFSIVLVDVWKATPYMALLILAALQMVPVDCYEAAQVDGVPRWQVFRRITLPLILPGILVAVVFRTLDALRVFDLIYVMTSNSRDTQSMSVFVREQLIDFGLVGYGSAAATCLFFMIALLSIVAMGLMRKAFERAAA
ncbi:sugar ABC transporter permease [Candidatus Accumulibacter sp. ACC003]|uniref:carbohydrate ABC transporter permease n=1 Tax=Candidatus Accumulibacter sp. ACC003 TaxID=2823334 RepID=UPI0025BDDAA6|nr:sugar ABC transporter permease [Candidatus Accumulibacter sp. ACC003]